VCSDLSYEGEDNSKNQDVDGRIILKLILEKQVRKAWTGYIWLRTGTSGGFLSTR
jgi:hypothetical protein